MLLVRIFLSILLAAMPFIVRSQNPEPPVACDSVLQPFDAGKPQSVGLVLSGGGAKGIAHVGVIRALEENNIPIDYIAGTSMGAIVGGLYACGYTPEKMMELFTSEDFAYWSTGKTDPDLVYYFSRDISLPVMYGFDFALTKADSIRQVETAVPASLINPLPMNFAFMDLFAAYTAQCGGDFNSLMVPFRCVASDVEEGHKVVHSSGSLGDAIRTSMSFPVVFQPIKMGGNLLYDGGIYDNFPVDVMTTDFAPDIMLGVDVAASAQGPQTSIMDQIENLVMRSQSYVLPPDQGIKMRIHLDEFSLLDFASARQIEKIGYDYAIAMMDSIKGRVTSRISPIARETRRNVFLSETPEVIFDKIDVDGGSEQQDRYIHYLFQPAHTDTFGLASARESYYRAITPGRLRDLFPQAIYNDTTGRFTLDLHVAPKDNFSVGLGGYITSSANSFLFVNGAYRTLTFTSLNTSVNAWIGQSYMAGSIDAALNLHTSIPSAIGFRAVASRQRFYESDHLFYQVKTPSFIASHEYFGRFEWRWASGRRGQFTASAGYGHLYDSFFRTNSLVSFEIGRDHLSTNLGVVRLDYESNTLDNDNYPTKGNSYFFSCLGAIGSLHFRGADPLVPDQNMTQRFLQAESRTRNFFDLDRHFSLGIETDVLVSTRKLCNNYNASLIFAPEYCPAVSAYNTFNIGYRANSFAAVSAVPVYKYNSSLSARASLSCFAPFRRIESDMANRAHYGKWFANPQFFGQADVTFQLPFAAVSAYVSYATGRSKPWGVGLSFGLFFTAPRLLR